MISARKLFMADGQDLTAAAPTLGLGMRSGLVRTRQTIARLLVIRIFVVLGVTHGVYRDNLGLP